MAVLVSVALAAVLLALLRQNEGRSSDALVVYCAAGAQRPMERVAREYENACGVSIHLQYGGSGTLLSIFMGFFEKLEDYVLPVLHVIMGVPALSWVIFSIIWFPDVEMRILFILVACCAPNYTLEIHDAIKAIPKDLKEMLESFRPTRRQLFSKLILPSIIPAVLTSWKINVGYATRVAMVAELVGATAGVGFQLLSAQEMFDMPGAIAWTLVLVTFLLLSQFLLGRAESKLLSYRPSTR